MAEARRGKPTQQEIKRGLKGIAPASEEAFMRVADEDLDNLAGRAYRLGDHLSRNPRDLRAKAALVRVVNKATDIATSNALDITSGEPFTSR